MSDDPSRGYSARGKLASHLEHAAQFRQQNRRYEAIDQIRQARELNGILWPERKVTQEQRDAARQSIAPTTQNESAPQRLRREETPQILALPKGQYRLENDPMVNYLYEYLMQTKSFEDDYIAGHLENQQRSATPMETKWREAEADEVMRLRIIDGLTIDRAQRVVFDRRFDQERINDPMVDHLENQHNLREAKENKQQDLWQDLWQTTIQAGRAVQQAAEAQKAPIQTKQADAQREL